MRRAGAPLADDHGIAILAGRKRFWTGRSSHHYFFAWSDVIGYRSTSPMVGRASDIGMAKTHNTQLTIYTRREQYCWELPLSQAQVRANLEHWLTSPCRPRDLKATHTARDSPTHKLVARPAVMAVRPSA